MCVCVCVCACMCEIMPQRIVQFPDIYQHTEGIVVPFKYFVCLKIKSLLIKSENSCGSVLYIEIIVNDKI